MRIFLLIVLKKIAGIGVRDYLTQVKLGKDSLCFLTGFGNNTLLLLRETPENIYKATEH